MQYLEADENHMRSEMYHQPSHSREDLDTQYSQHLKSKTPKRPLHVEQATNSENPWDLSKDSFGIQKFKQRWVKHSLHTQSCPALHCTSSQGLVLGHYTARGLSHITILKRVELAFRSLLHEAWFIYLLFGFQSVWWICHKGLMVNLQEVASQEGANCASSATALSPS